MKLGVTGHRNIPPSAIPHIRAEMMEIIGRYAPITGLSSLAAGADQLFALSILKTGNRLHVLIPCKKYELTHQDADLLLYQRFLVQAENVEMFPFELPCEEAFFYAGQRLVDHSDLLIAVWDGKRADGVGGTADVVAYARKSDKPVTVIWPMGVSRT